MDFFLGTSFHSEKLTNLKDIIPKDDPIVFVVGAMAHGSVRLPMLRVTFSYLCCSLTTYFLA